MNLNQKKISVPLLIGLVGFPQISETIYTPALPSVAIGLSTSASMVEYTLAIYFLGFALGVLLWGMISDRYGRRVAMLAGLLIYGAATIGCGTVESVESLLGWRFIQAFGASVGSVITQTILRDSFDATKRAKLFSILSGALAFSPAIGPLIGGFVSDFLGWRANFLVLTIIAAILFFWSYFTLPETRPLHTNRSSIKIFQIFIWMMKSRILWGHILLISATNGVIFGFYQEAPFIYINLLGMQPSYYGFFGVLITAATIFAARVSYQKSQTSSPEAVIRFGAACVMTGGSIFTFMVLTSNFELSNMNIGISIITLLIIFFGIGLIIPNSLSQALKPFQTASGTAGSIFGGCYYCLIAGSTGLLSIAHNETALPLSLYILALACLMLLGSQMVRLPKIELANIQ